MTLHAWGCSRNSETLVSPMANLQSTCLALLQQPGKWRLCCRLPELHELPSEVMFSFLKA